MPSERKEKEAAIADRLEKEEKHECAACREEAEMADPDAPGAASLVDPSAAIVPGDEKIARWAQHIGRADGLDGHVPFGGDAVEVTVDSLSAQAPAPEQLASSQFFSAVFTLVDPHAAEGESEICRRGMGQDELAAYEFDVENVVDDVRSQSDVMSQRVTLVLHQDFSAMQPMDKGYIDAEGVKVQTTRLPYGLQLVMVQ